MMVSHVATTLTQLYAGVVSESGVAFVTCGGVVYARAVFVCLEIPVVRMRMKNEDPLGPLKNLS